MSTVLKAVQEIERRATPLASSLESRESADRWPWAIVAAGIVTVGVVAAFVAMGGVPHVQPAAPVIAPPPRAPVAVEPPALARTAPAVVAPAPVAAPLPALEEAPRGQVVPKAASRAEASEARPQSARVERRPRVAAVRPPPPVYEEEETEIEPALAPPPAPANARAGSASGPLPRVELRAIGYANNPDARTVTLRIGGGSAVTMHEGESMQGVDVQLILPGSVYLRHGGSIFSIGR